jgi:hypothetical protein
LNGKPVFQRLVLDQGFYPDGIWTAPSDEALRRDIELSKAAGFNGARLHMKVFEPRLLYWADKLGYLGWGEFPCWGLEYTKPEVNLPMMREWTEVIRRDRNHPCIILWCPFAETCEEAVPLQNAVVSLTRDLDPSRPIIDASAWTHGLPDLEILDVHDFDQDPSAFREKWSKKESAIPFMVSDYGGIGWDIEEGWAYGEAPKDLDEFYARHADLTHVLLENRFMFGFCYCQLTDVEQERNGIYTYDRRPKFDIAGIKAVNSRAAAYEKDPPVEG